MYNIWQSKTLENYPRVLHGLSLRDWGNMSSSFFQGNVKENRAKLFNYINVDLDNVFIVPSSHSSVAMRIYSTDSQTSAGGFDAAYTSAKDVLLCATFADCIPVFLFSPKDGIVGLIHAGWRGVLGEVVAEALGQMRQEGVDLANLYVSVGPHIQGSCFEVGEEVEQFFGVGYPECVIKGAEKKAKIDLKKAVFKQILNAGVEHNNVEVSAICVHCDRSFYSNRRDKREGAMLGFIGIR